MTQLSYRDRLDAHLEARDIHVSVCRYRRSGLICSTCGELAERAERAAAALVKLLGEVA